MTRFFGNVGYGESVEDPPGSGIWKEEITEQSYYGDELRTSRVMIPGDKVNDDISVSNQISIVADENAIKNFLKIKYVDWAGVKWTVTNVEVRSPRLILNLGSPYNG